MSGFNPGCCVGSFIHKDSADLSERLSPFENFSSQSDRAQQVMVMLSSVSDHDYFVMRYVLRTVFSFFQ